MANMRESAACPFDVVMKEAAGQNLRRSAEETVGYVQIFPLGLHASEVGIACFYRLEKYPCWIFVST